MDSNGSTLSPEASRAGWDGIGSSRPPRGHTYLQSETNGLELRWRWSGKRDSNPRHSAWKADALPTELFPHRCNRFAACNAGQTTGWRVVDLNHRRRKPADLQSAPIDPSGNPPVLLHLCGCAVVSSAAWLQDRGSGCKDRVVRRVAWSWRWDSNPQPADYKSAALPIELHQRRNCTSDGHQPRLTAGRVPGLAWGPLVRCGRDMVDKSLRALCCRNGKFNVLVLGSLRLRRLPRIQGLRAQRKGRGRLV